MSDNPFKPNDDAEDSEEKVRETDPLYALQKAVLTLTEQGQVVLAKLTGIESRQASIEQGIINLGTRVEALETEQVNLRNLVESRLQDTRPLWEALRQQIYEIDIRTDSFLKSIYNGVVVLERKLDVINRELLGLKAGHDGLVERIDEIERKAS